MSSSVSNCSSLPRKTHLKLSNLKISYISCAMIGQFGGPFFPVRLAKFKMLFKVRSSPLCLNSEIQ